MNELSKLRKRLINEYRLYTLGYINKKEYCIRVKPIDRDIDRLEMATLQGIPDVKESFLQHVQKLKH